MTVLSSFADGASGKDIRDTINDALVRTRSTTSVQQTSKPIGEGGNPSTERLYLSGRDSSIVVENDRTALQEDIYYAARSGRSVFIDPTSTKTLTSGMVIPSNTRCDFRRAQIQPDVTLTTGSLTSYAQRAGNAFDWGSMRGLNLLQPYISDAAGFHPDQNKNVDGNTYGDSVGEVRHFHEENVVIRGFRKGRVYTGKDVFINSIINANISGNWSANIEWACTANSGERMVYIASSFSDCRNPSGTGTSINIIPESTDPDMYFFGTSFSYNDIDLFISHGSVDAFGCHFENNGNRPKVRMRTTDERKPPSFIAIGGMMVGGPHSTWNNKAPYNRPTENLSGRPCIIDLESKRCTVIILGTDLTKYTEKTCTEVVRNITRAEQNKIWIKPRFDGGYKSLTANGVGNGPLGRGSFPAFCYTLGNCLYLPVNGSLTGLTSNTGTSAATDRFLNVDTGSHRINRTTAGTTSGAISYPLVPISPGEVAYAETSVHLSGYVDGVATLRIEFYVDAAGTIKVPNVSGEIIQGILTNTGISSTEATITIPDPVNYPNTGLYTPGTMQSGVHTVGQDLSASVSGAFTANTTSGSNQLVVTAVSSGTLAVGDAVYGAGIPVNAIITAGSGGTGTYTISSNATATASGISITSSRQLITGRCYITANNGDGTWTVDIANTYGSGAVPTNVAATTICGWERVAAAKPCPDGANYVKLTEYITAVPGSSNIEMDGRFCRTRLHKG